MFFVLIALMFVGARAGDGPGVQRGPRPRDRLHGQHRREPAPASPPSASLSYLQTPPRRLVRDRAGALRCTSCRAGRRWQIVRRQMAVAARRSRGLGTRRTGRSASGRRTTRFSYHAGDRTDQHQQHRPPADGEHGRDGRRRLRAAAPAEPRRRAASRSSEVLIIGAGSGNDVAAALALRREARGRRRDRSGDLRDRPARIIPTTRTTTRGSRSTSTTGGASCAGRPASTT